MNLLEKPNLNSLDKKAVLKVLNSPILTHGLNSQVFEKIFRKNLKFHMLHPYLVALPPFICYLAIGTKKGDEIIVPNQTHVSTVHACEILGAKPIFIDYLIIKQET